MTTLRSTLAMLVAVSIATLAACAQDELQEAQQTSDSPQAQGLAPAPGNVEPAELGQTDRVHVCRDVLLASQPAAPADFTSLREQEYRSVLNLRTQQEMDELDFDQPALLEDEGLHYYHVPVAGADGLTDEVLDRVRRILNDADNRPILVHCASANRVGAVWLVHRVLDADLDYEAALAEAREVGLRSEELEQRARAYIEAQQPS